MNYLLATSLPFCVESLRKAICHSKLLSCTQAPVLHRRIVQWALWQCHAAWHCWAVNGGELECSAEQKWAESLIRELGICTSTALVVFLNVLLIATFLSLQPVPTLLLRSRWYAPHFVYLHLWQVSGWFILNHCYLYGQFPLDICKLFSLGTWCVCKCHQSEFWTVLEKPKKGG